MMSRTAQDPDVTAASGARVLVAPGGRFAHKRGDFFAESMPAKVSCLVSSGEFYREVWECARRRRNSVPPVGAEAETCEIVA